ncbi:MAG: GDYXXLXY domain-containing protein [Bacteroidota bacterium]|jgi:uncharacterized membrane-anchored protein
MSENRKISVAVIGLILVLLLFNVSVWQKMGILSNGNFVLLEMAPVDPRPPMQGDYMELNYKATMNISTDSIPHKGYCIVRSVSGNLFEKVRFQENISPLGDNEIAISYSVHKGRIHIGSSTFFFQEGTGPLYDRAKYAGMRVSRKGQSVLVGLYDENQMRIR